MGRISLIAGVLTFVALTTPMRANVIPPGPQAVATWTSLGPGTSYSVLSSTDLLTWTSLTNTAATNVNLSLGGNTMCVYRLLASDAPPQSTTLAWKPSISAGVAGYNIYYGGATGNYTNRMDVGLATNGVVTNLLAAANYYFVTTAYTSSVMESDYSNEAVWQCPLFMSIQQSP